MTKFDDSALTAVMGRSAPAMLDRAGRIRLIGEAAQSLRDEKMPSREAALFLGGALLAWLENGGDLERQYLQVTKRASHHTPAVIWRGLIADERHDPEKEVE
jgi:hypothetical protein